MSGTLFSSGVTEIIGGWLVGGFTAVPIGTRVGARVGGFVAICTGTSVSVGSTVGGLFSTGVAEGSTGFGVEVGAIAVGGIAVGGMAVAGTAVAVFGSAVGTMVVSMGGGILVIGTAVSLGVGTAVV